jgi:hypothetical protein
MQVIENKSAIVMVEAAVFCPYKSFVFKYLLVEAAGVEPASENDDSKEPTYVVTFLLRELPRNLRSRR